MDTGVRITVLHNCALILSAGGRSVMIDALSKGTDAFEGISREDLTRAMNGQTPFEGICAALYTHTHPDHFDRGLNERYAQRFGVPMFIPDRDLGSEGSFEVGGFEVKYHRIAHSGAEYAGVRHYVFLIGAGGAKIYIGGDADFNSEEHFAFLGGVKPDAAFLNALYLSAQQPVIERIGAKETFIYHIPSQPDAEGIRRLAFEAYRHHEELWERCSLIGSHPITIKLQ